MTAISVSLGRTLLGLGSLDLANGGSDPIQFGEFTPSGVTVTRVTATAPWIDGRRPRAFSKSQSSLDGEFYIVTAIGTSEATHDGHLQDLVDALGQFAWTLSVDSGDLTRTYECEPADYQAGESLNVADTWHWTTVKVTIPHAPVPTAGAW